MAATACRPPHSLLPASDDLPRALSAAVPAAAQHAGHCRRHPLASAATSANEEAGTAGSGDFGLFAGRSGHSKARGSRQPPSTPGTAPLSPSSPSSSFPDRWTPAIRRPRVHGQQQWLIQWLLSRSLPSLLWQRQSRFTRFLIPHRVLMIPLRLLPPIRGNGTIAVIFTCSSSVAI
uniref:Uncharacterized protein n=1 Tax=Oryza rufipogon TaxID=4529 RepID=A0A0E0Q8U6_ORYRU